MNRFMDIVVSERPAMTVSYRSGLMVYEEGLRDGRWVSLSYNANGHLMAANCRPEPTWMPYKSFAAPEAFRLNIDGQSMHSHWQWGGIEIDRGEEQIKTVVTLRHAVRPITVRIHTLIDGTAVFQRWLEVENTGDKAAAMASVSPLSGAVQHISFAQKRVEIGEGLYRIGYMKHSSWGNEGDFHWEELPDEIYTITGRNRRQRYRHPMAVIENGHTGETFIIQFGWTGGYAMTFDLDRQTAGEARLSMDIAIDAPAPLRMIAAGDTAVTPSVHMGVTFGGLDEAVQQMHDHVRASVFPAPTDGVSGWIEAGIGPEFDMDLATTLAAVDHAASVGVEVFFIDAGWYLEPDHEDDWWKFCGDWSYNKQRYPNGIEQVRDYVHKKGLRFGMWMDAERIGPASKVWQEHEEWVARNYTGEKNASGLLNLAEPEVCAWMEKQIRKLIDEYGVDMFRLDYNVGTDAAICMNERDGYLENTFMRYYQNVYDMYKRLRSDYPSVIFENCAGGGGRSDLGMVAGFTHTWVTDWQIHPRAFSITNGMTMALPPECVDRLIGGQAAYLTADVQTLIRNLIFARPTIGTFTASGALQNPVQADIVRHHVDIYKNFVRPMQRDSLSYHHTPDLSRALDGFGVLETAKRDKSQGMLGVFRLAEPEVCETTVYPRGVNPGKMYDVTFDNSGATVRLSGFDMVQNGLRVRLGSALTSELILYKEAEA